MIRINAVKHFLSQIPHHNIVEQTCLPAGRDVKEDLKTIICHTSNAICNNFRLNQSLECWQKYRLYCFIRYFCDSYNLKSISNGTTGQRLYQTRKTILLHVHPRRQSCIICTRIDRLAHHQCQ